MSHFGTDAPGDPDGPPEERSFQFTDRRRIDPRSGEVRDGGSLPQPGSAAANPGDPANAGQPVTARVTDPSDELAAALQQVTERTSDLQRITAEYANYRKRTERDRQQAVESGKTAVLLELLTVLDDLDRAQEHGDLTGGFKTVADKLVGVLGRLGLAGFGADGDAFDPNLHEAVQFGTSVDVRSPTVTTVLRRGYQVGERVLRPAVVGVTGPEHEAGSADAAPSADTQADAEPNQSAGAAAGTGGSDSAG